MKGVITIPALKTQTVFKKPNELLLHNQGSSSHTGLQSDWETTNSQGHCTLQLCASRLNLCIWPCAGETLPWFLIWYSEENIEIGTTGQSETINFPKSTLPLLLLLICRKRRQLFSIKCETDMLKYKLIETHSDKTVWVLIEDPCITMNLYLIMQSQFGKREKNNMFCFWACNSLLGYFLKEHRHSVSFWD